MKKEYFCDYFSLEGKSGQIELDYAKVVYTKESFEPDTISVRLMLSRITPQLKRQLHIMSERKVNVVWVPYDKEYMLEMTGDLHHIKNGEDSYSFRVTENNVPTIEEQQENLALLKEILNIGDD